MALGQPSQLTVPLTALALVLRVGPWQPDACHLLPGDRRLPRGTHMDSVSFPSLSQRPRSPGAAGGWSGRQLCRLPCGRGAEDAGLHRGPGRCARAPRRRAAVSRAPRWVSRLLTGCLEPPPCNTRAPPAGRAGPAPSCPEAASQRSETPELRLLRLRQHRTGCACPKVFHWR